MEHDNLGQVADMRAFAKIVIAEELDSDGNSRLLVEGRFPDHMLMTPAVLREAERRYLQAEGAHLWFRLHNGSAHYKITGIQGEVYELERVESSIMEVE